MHIHQRAPDSSAWGYKQKLIALLKARGVPYDQLAREFDAGERKLHTEQY
ncbi:MAG: hypothetical protein M3P51_15565 [Chloroflexota bacterium]|nr:hypothetical protein [Chloroflexota bacterium]